MIRLRDESIGGFSVRLSIANFEDVVRGAGR